MSASKEKLIETIKLMLSNASFHQCSIELNPDYDDFLSGTYIEQVFIDFIKEQEDVSE